MPLSSAYKLKVCVEGQLIFSHSANSYMPEEMERPYHARDKAWSAGVISRMPADQPHAGFAASSSDSRLWVKGRPTAACGAVSGLRSRTGYRLGVQPLKPPQPGPKGDGRGNTGFCLLPRRCTPWLSVIGGFLPGRNPASLAKRGCASGKALRGDPAALSAVQRSEGSWAEAPCRALRADALSLGQSGGCERQVSGWLGRRPHLDFDVVAEAIQTIHQLALRQIGEVAAHHA